MYDETKTVREKVLLKLNLIFNTSTSGLDLQMPPSSKIYDNDGNTNIYIYVLHSVIRLFILRRRNIIFQTLDLIFVIRMS